MMPTKSKILLIFGSIFLYGLIYAIFVLLKANLYIVFITLFLVDLIIITELIRYKLFKKWYSWIAFVIIRSVINTYIIFLGFALQLPSDSNNIFLEPLSVMGEYLVNLGNWFSTFIIVWIACFIGNWVQSKLKKNSSEKV
jgi:hypothetical protein